MTLIGRYTIPQKIIENANCVSLPKNIQPLFQYKACTTSRRFPGVSTFFPPHVGAETRQRITRHVRNSALKHSSVKLVAANPDLNSTPPLGSKVMPELATAPCSGVYRNSNEPSVVAVKVPSTTRRSLLALVTKTNRSMTWLSIAVHRWTTPSDVLKNQKLMSVK